MLHTLIGSSNIYRLYSPELFSDYRPYNMVRCTNIDIFKAKMGCLDSKEEGIVISIIENILVDAVTLGMDNGIMEENQLMDIIKVTIQEVVGILKTTAEKFPNTKFAMIEPTLRPAVDWYTDKFEDICMIYNEFIDDLALSNVTSFDCFARESQCFDEKRVHLTPASMMSFIRSVLKAAESYFNSGGTESGEVDLTDEENEQHTGMEVDETRSLMSNGTGLLGFGVDQLLSGIEERIQELEERLGMQETSDSKRSYADNLMTARIREELDAIANTKKEDRIILIGLTNSIPMPSAPNEKKKWLNQMVCSLFNRIDPQSNGKILFINHGKRGDGRKIPMVEVKVDSREAAFGIRNGFVAKKKNGVNFGNLHVANSVTLATRVRTDILRGIANQFSVTGVTELYVTAYNSRPVLHVNEKGTNSCTYVLTFADAIVKYGKNLKEEYLADAYRKVGNSFPGQLEQHFVVLKNRNEGPWMQPPELQQNKHHGWGQVLGQNPGWQSGQEKGKKRSYDDGPGL